MAKPPPNDDPDVTDLARYRKAKAKAEAATRAASRPTGAGPGGQGRGKSPSPKQSLLGSNPRAGLILAIAALVLLALWFGPMLF